MEITRFDQLDLSKSYTYADYYSWKFPERVELFRGKVMPMALKSNTRHQAVSRNMTLQMYNYLENKPFEIYFAPFDVRLDAFEDDLKVKSVVQPDICVISDISKLDERGCLGVPELVIEILIPKDIKKEMKYKFELYESFGVQEYWIVDPSEKVVFQYSLENGRLTNHRPLIEEDSLSSTVIKGFTLDLKHVFKD